MLKNILKVNFSITLLLFILTSCQTSPAKQLYSITPSDIILVVAPHPDDEVLACGGIVQQAKEKNAKINILYITNGEHNRLSLLYYKKRLLVKSRKDYVNLGKIRIKESKHACKILGLKEKNLIFLGYPDSGILEIFLRHWRKAPSFVDSLSKSKSVGKSEGITAFAPYKGESILADIKKVLLKVKPTKIFFPSPFDDNKDHIGVYLFCKTALWDLKSKLAPEEFLYQVHQKEISFLERYNTDWCRDVANYFDNKYANMCVYFNLSNRQTENKKEAISEFKTQMYCSKFLYSFAGNKEVFELSMPPVVFKNAKYTFGGYLINPADKKIGKVFLKIGEGNLFLNIKLQSIKKLKRADIFTLGYKRKSSFFLLPKVHIGLRYDKYAIYNQNQKIPSKKGSFCKFHNGNIEIKIPLRMLGNPEMIFFYLNGFSKQCRFSFPWRILYSS